MKITKAQIKQIIREEMESIIGEQDDGAEIMAAIEDVPPAAEQIADRIKKEIEKLAEPSGLEPQVLAQAVAALLTAD
tara:strand:- start:19741 stop:19971 length:231 start_codon:yes stop_codon:yes gene_type:complete